MRRPIANLTMSSTESCLHRGLVDDDGDLTWLVGDGGLGMQGAGDTCLPPTYQVSKDLRLTYSLVV